MKILIATTNAGKLREFRNKLLEHFPQREVLGLSDVKLPPFPPENGETFAENAKVKALHAATHTQLQCIADDSGLVVDALNGRPGVYSARYAGEHATDAENNQKLLEELANFPAPKRRARFVCALALATAEGSTQLFEGTCEGRILSSLQGEGGFGYDPLFAPKGMGKSFAEVSLETKNRLSHRARALDHLLSAIKGP